MTYLDNKPERMSCDRCGSDWICVWEGAEDKDEAPDECPDCRESGFDAFSTEHCNWGW